MARRLSVTLAIALTTTIGVSDTRLGTVRCLQINERRLGSVGQPELLGRAAKFVPRVNDFLGRSFFLQLHGYRFGVPIFHSHSIALRTHRELCWIDVGSIQFSQE